MNQSSKPTRIFQKKKKKKKLQTPNVWAFCASLAASMDQAHLLGSSMGLPYSELTIMRVSEQLGQIWQLFSLYTLNFFFQKKRMHAWSTKQNYK